MEQTRIGFIVFGVHKDGLADPMAAPLIDPNVVAGSVAALNAAGLQPVEADVAISTKQEARACQDRFKKMDEVQAIVLFSGTWVWAAHLTAE